VSEGAIALRVASRTDVGRTRERNEDNLYAGKRIYAVADGLGGHRAGEVASEIAAGVMRELDRDAKGNLADALEESFRTANRLVLQRASEDPETRGMSTTLTALAVENSSAHLAHVGDSRCYLLREGEMTLLSRDHTLVARMVAEGSLSPEEAETHPQRSIITRALGAEPHVDVDTMELALQPGDRLLLCSDGLSSVVPAAAIEQALRETDDIEALARALVDDANNRGGPDNITVLLVEVPSDAQFPAAPPRPRETRTIAPPRRRRVPMRRLVGLGLVVVLILGGLIVSRTWINSNYYVGVSDGKVAIFRGLPANFLGMNLHSLLETTPVMVDEVAPYFRNRLSEGITVPSVAAARRKVSEIPRGGPTPTPTPSPTPTGSPT
jgi:PPM family protein phosphatase